VSVLNTVPVWSDSSPATALREAIDLAGAAEAMGYHRYWVAEHHNTVSVASAAPAVLVGQLAAATSSLQVGSGGVMLPNHAPLVVAEEFGTLRALHPGRIDLGVGRAPVTDAATAVALRRAADADFPRQLVELIGYFDAPWPDAGRPVTAVPAAGNKPPIWLLGTSLDSARLAARLGLPYAFAHHFNPGGAAAAAAEYRRAFQPSPELDRPYVILAATVIVAETAPEAARLALPVAVSALRRRSGQSPQPLPTEEQAAAHPMGPVEREIVADRVRTHVIGDPAQVRARIAELVTTTGADELMATTAVRDYGQRLRSYELLVKAVASG